MKRLLPALALIGLLLCALTSCIDPEPGEISVICVKNGKPTGCRAMLFNSAGKQIQEEDTDTKGIGYFKKIKPGRYIVKFQDKQGTQMFPAEVEVTLKAGASMPLRVELTEAPAVEEGS